MATSNIVDACKEYLVQDVHTVDTMTCVAGSKARCVKPGGVAKIMNSIRKQGYTNVHLNTHHVNTHTFPCRTMP